ncbi:hypothetical protein Salat_2716500 [Sesamum alatum]|uniref:Uncharacterized protein n=1 Tax=Sesamum alatum TaxID=300844 RepID=A0AAE2CBK6_9LAMI|nr:hypothetical protein Salat_2716500 [Sesamum alatum]
MVHDDDYDIVFLCLGETPRGKNYTEPEDDYELNAYDDTDSSNDDDVQFLGMHIKHANGDGVDDVQFLGMHIKLANGDGIRTRDSEMEIGVERISEAEFRQTHHVPKIGSSVAAESARVYAGKDKDDDTIKESASVCPRTRGSRTSSDRSRQFDQNKRYAACKSALLQEDEQRSHGSEHEIGIASWTRSRRGVARKPTTVNDISLDLLDGSSPCDSRLSDSSSSSDQEADDSEDEDFATEQDDCSDGIELSDSHNEEESIDQHASKRQKFASPKVHKDEVQGDRNKRAAGNIGNCSSRQDSLRNRPGRRLCTRKDYDLYKDNTELDDYDLKDTDSLDDDDFQFLGIKQANGERIRTHNHRTEMEVERISEVEFRQTHHGMKIESSLAAESARGYAGKDIDDDTTKELASDCPRIRGSRTSSDRGRELDQNKRCADCKRALLQEDEERSHGSEHEIGIASRTRSKRGVTRKPTTVDDISLDLSDGSSSPSDSRLSDSPSSSDHEADNSEDEDFAMEHYDCSDGIELSNSHNEEESTKIQEFASSSQMFTKKEFKEDEDDEGIDRSWSAERE